MLNQLFKSILEQDRAPIVVCDKDSQIVYMNPSAKAQYHGDLTGRNVKDCHNSASVEKIDRVLAWFGESSENNLIFTYYDAKKNKDVYMVALRDDAGALIGYYEKHESRDREAMQTYDCR